MMQGVGACRRRRRRRRLARLAPLRQNGALRGGRSESAGVRGLHISATGGRGGGVRVQEQQRRVNETHLLSPGIAV